MLVFGLAACGADDRAGRAPADAGADNSAGSAGSAGTGGARAFSIASMPIELTRDVWAWPADTTSWPASQFPPIHVFGKDYQGKVESTLTFDMAKVGSTVLAPITGRVIDVRPQPESCDVELYLSSDAAQQVLSLDHVVATVRKGDMVTAGQAVATVPAWQCKEPFGRFELMMVRETAGTVQAFCPADFWSADLAPKAAAQIRAVMEKWNTHAAGSKSVYTSSELANGVCSTPTAPAN